MWPRPSSLIVRRRVARRLLSTLAYGDGAGPLGSAAAAVEFAHGSFLSVCGESGDPAVRLSEWMQTYYRRPRPELLRGAIVEALRTPGAFAGPAAFPAAVFLSTVLARAAASPAELRSFLQFCATAARATAAGGADGAAWAAEPLDTVLRAMYLARSPLFDRHLEHIVVSARLGAAGGDDDADRRAELGSVAASIFPGAATAARRAPLPVWPLPSLAVASFQATLAGDEFPAFGATRFLFMHTHAAHVMARRDPRKFVAAVPGLARIVTESVVDGLWTRFYATGDALGTVARVLDAATPYADFVEEYGDAWVTRFGGGAADARFAGVPDEFEDDPYGAMRFATSRYALWTLLVNAATHTVVGQAFARHLAVLMDRLSLMDPIERETLVTAFGNKRVELMRMLAPAIAEMFAAADRDGIGSGAWPERFTAHERGASPPATRLVSDGGTAGQHHAAPALESRLAVGASALRPPLSGPPHNLK